jgi:hypothetical protein
LVGWVDKLEVEEDVHLAVAERLDSSKQVASAAVTVGHLCDHMFVVLAVWT